MKASVMKQKALKAKKLAIAEATYTQTRKISGEYESGRIAWPNAILESRRNALIAKNEKARKELEKYGII